MKSPTVELDSRTGWSVWGVAGWPDHRFVGVEVDLYRGRPVLVAFRIEPLDPDAEPVPLTGERLARVPATLIANAVAQWTDLGTGRVNAQVDALSDLGGPVELPPYTRGGSDEWHRAILAISAEAHARGRSAIAAIATAAGVGRDRAKQYSANARRWETEHRTTPTPTPTPIASAAVLQPMPDREPLAGFPRTPEERDRRTGRSRGRGSIDTRQSGTKGEHQ